MTIRIACPKCGSAHGIADRLMGREVRCPDCDARLQVPDADQIRRLRDAAAARKQHRASAAATEAARAAAVTAPAPRSTLPPEADEPEPPPLERRRDRSEPDMDMTPMVDVTFLLLIFFMVTAAFQLQKSITVPNIQSDDPSLTQQDDPPDQPDVVTVQVDEFNSFVVLAPDWEREVPGKQNLTTALRDARNGIRSGTVRLIIEAHVDAKHRAVVDAMDAGTEAGFAELEVMDVEEFGLF